MSAQVRAFFPVQNGTDTYTGMETILYYRKTSDTTSDSDLIDIIDNTLMENWNFNIDQGLGNGDLSSLEITNIGNVHSVIEQFTVNCTLSNQVNFKPHHP